MLQVKNLSASNCIEHTYDVIHFRSFHLPVFQYSICQDFNIPSVGGFNIPSARISTFHLPVFQHSICQYFNIPSASISTFHLPVFQYSICQGFQYSIFRDFNIPSASISTWQYFHILMSLYTGPEVCSYVF